MITAPGEPSAPAYPSLRRYTRRFLAGTIPQPGQSLPSSRENQRRRDREQLERHRAEQRPTLRTTATFNRSVIRTKGSRT